MKILSSSGSSVSKTFCLNKAFKSRLIALLPIIILEEVVDDGCETEAAVGLFDPGIFFSGIPK